MKVYNLYKKVGQTPLEVLELLRKKKKISSKSSLTYAGRLDPMACGVLLILQDATQKQREKYMNLDKTYCAKILFGIKTDSYDLLGMPSQGAKKIFSRKIILSNIKKYQGVFELPVPPYSSVQYRGKSLFEWARKGKIKTINLPNRKTEIKNIQLAEVRTIPSSRLLKTIIMSVKKVRGDFRQAQILRAWNKLSPYFQEKYQILEVQISCASGTYIRSIANDFGKKIGTRSLLFSLERLRVEKYSVRNSLQI